MAVFFIPFGGESLVDLPQIFHWIFKMLCDMCLCMKGGGSYGKAKTVR